MVWVKVCHFREELGDVAGARTFLSAATPESSTGSECSRDLLPFDVAADKNARAPLRFQLRGPESGATDQPAAGIDPKPRVLFPEHEVAAPVRSGVRSVGQNP